MLARGLLALVLVTAAVASPVPKSLRKPPDLFATARFKVRYSKTPFETVLKHFADETGLEWVGDRPELRTVTLQANRVYTAAEYLDVLNDILELDNFIVIRHGKTFYLHAAGQPFDVEKVDTIAVEEIVLPREPAKPVGRPVANPWGGGRWENGQWVPANGVAVVDADPSPPPPPSKRGKTEVVTAVIPLTTAAYDDISPQVKRSLSPFGRVEVCEDEKSMRVTDRVDNLRFVTRVLTAEPIRCGPK